MDESRAVAATEAAEESAQAENAEANAASQVPAASDPKAKPPTIAEQHELVAEMQQAVMHQQKEAMVGRCRLNRTTSR